MRMHVKACTTSSPYVSFIPNMTGRGLQLVQYPKHPGASSIPDPVKEHRESIFLPAGGAVRKRAWMAWTQILQLMEDEDNEVSSVLNHAAARAPAICCALIQPCA